MPGSSILTMRIENGGRRIDRLDHFAQMIGINDNQLTKETGLAVGTLGKSRKPDKDLSVKTVSLIAERFPQLNREWLLTGNGEMWSRPELPSFPTYPIIDLNLYRASSKNNSLADMVRLDSNQYVSLPEIPHETQFFIRAVSSFAAGSAHDFRIELGDLVGLSKIGTMPLRWGELYLLATADGFQLKRIRPAEGDRILCVADDSDRFPSFSLSSEEIKEYARVTCIIRCFAR